MKGERPVDPQLFAFSSLITGLNKLSQGQNKNNTITKTKAIEAFNWYHEHSGTKKALP